MKLSKMSLMRTRLRAVNLEYSLLVRQTTGAERFARMGELKAERQALMAQLAGGSDPSEIVRPGQTRAEAANEHASQAPVGMLI